MRLLAIGDIHGHTDALEALLDEINPGPTDKLVFLGDYVDKGPDVAGTLELLWKLSQDHHWIFLRGNHDQMLLDAYRDPLMFGVWECLAGDHPLASYGAGSTMELLRQIPQRHIHFLENRCLDYYETDTFIFVHGGIRPQFAPEEEEIERLQWTVLSSAAAHLSGRTVICGHSSQGSGKIADLGHTICIDTGITKGSYLSCLDVGDFSYIQSSADGEIRKGILRGLGQPA
jgi:serine/threonine protein phosphatase 1